MIPVGEMVFVDTNVMLGATDEGRGTHQACERIISQSTLVSWCLVTSQQVLREYLVVATRPQPQNGLGMSASQALSNVNELLRFVSLLDPEPRQWGVLESLVRNKRLTGKRIHDANIVACMQTHAVDHLLTDNPGDFEGIGSLTIWTSLKLNDALN